MNRFPCCCFLPSDIPQFPDETQLPERRISRSGSHLTQSLPARTRISEDRRSFESSHQSSRRSNEKYIIINEGTTCSLKLECFIIPSFGKDPPINVAVKKESSSDFLKGVGDDLEVIQDLIGRDKQKELGKVQLMCHFEQVKRAQFASTIEKRMKDLKLDSADNDQKGCK